MMPQGKKTRPDVRYSKEVADEVCRLMATGLSPSRISKMDGMPSDSSIQDWDRKDVDGFSGKYARAREALYAYWAAEVIDIPDTATLEEVNLAKLRVDSRKWTLSKLLPKVYGDKTAVEHSGGVSLNVVTGVPEPDGETD